MTRAIDSGGTARAASSGGIHSRLAGVSITDGSTQLTRIPAGRSSSASSSVIRTTAALLAAWATGALPDTAVFEPTVTIAPPTAAAIRDAACWADHSNEVTLEPHIWA